MWRTMSVVAVVMLVTASTCAQGAKPRRAAPKRSAPNTVRILNQRVPEVRFQDTPLDQVMQWLTEFTKLNITVRWQTLVDAGIERDKPITLQVNNLRLGQILSLILAEAGGPDLKLAYRASGNLLVLSTADDLNKEMVTKVYDVSDLLVRIIDAPQTSGFDVTRGLGQSGGGGGGGGGGSSSGMFGQGGGQSGAAGGTGMQGGQNQQGNEVQMQELVDIIQQTIEPDSWKLNGGAGSITPFQRALIVRNTILVHQQLGGYVTEKEAGALSR